MNLGESGTILLTCIGSIAIISRREHRYLSACLNSNPFSSTTIWGFPLINLFIGVKNPGAAVIINMDWQNLPTIV